MEELESIIEEFKQFVEKSKQIKIKDGSSKEIKESKDKESEEIKEEVEKIKVYVRNKNFKIFYKIEINLENHKLREIHGKRNSMPKNRKNNFER